MEVQEKLFDTAETETPPLAPGNLGRTHIPDFEDIPRAERKYILQAFEGGHVKPEIIKRMRSSDLADQRRLTDQIGGVEAALKIEKHIQICSHCRHLSEHPESLATEGSLLEQ